MTYEAARQRGTETHYAVTVGDPDNDTRICALAGCNEIVPNDDARRIYCCTAHAKQFHRNKEIRENAARRKPRPCVLEGCENMIPADAPMQQVYCSESCRNIRKRKHDAAREREKDRKARIADAHESMAGVRFDDCPRAIEADRYGRAPIPGTHVNSGSALAWE